MILSEKFAYSIPSTGLSCHFPSTCINIATWGIQPVRHTGIFRHVGSTMLYIPYHPIQSHILVDLFPIKSYALQCPGARLSYHAGVSWSHHGDPATGPCVARVFDGYFMWIHRYTQYMLWDMTKQLDIP